MTVKKVDSRKRLIQHHFSAPKDIHAATGLVLALLGDMEKPLRAVELFWIFLILLAPFATARADDAVDPTLAAAVQTADRLGIATVVNAPSGCSGAQGPQGSAIIIADSGTESGGGGTVVDVNDRSLLLDLFQLDASKKLSDPDQIQIDGKIYSKSRFSDDFISKAAMAPKLVPNELRHSDSLSPREIRSLEDFLNSGAMRLAEKTISDWNASEDTFVLQFNMLNRSKSKLLSKIVWKIQTGKVDGAAAPVAPFGRADLSNPRLAALFTNTDRGMKDGKRDIGLQIQVNAREWNKLSLLSQTGLILHEYLRAAQFMDIVPGKVFRAYDDRELQVATSALLACKPDSVMSMYLSMTLTGLDKMMESNPAFGSYPQMLSNHCAARAGTRPE